MRLTGNYSFFCVKDEKGAKFSDTAKCVGVEWEKLLFRSIVLTSVGRSRLGLPRNAWNIPWRQDDSSEAPGSLLLFCSHGCFSFFPDDEAVVEVHIPGSESSEAIFRKRTAGILDMGGVSTQIAYEVPKTVSFASSQQVIICTNFLLFDLVSFNMFPFIFVLFSESEHVFTVLAEVPPSQPRRKEEAETKAALPLSSLCLFIEVSWFVFWPSGEGFFGIDVSHMLEFLFLLFLQSLLFLKRYSKI